MQRRCFAPFDVHRVERRNISSEWHSMRPYLTPAHNNPASYLTGRGSGPWSHASGCDRPSLRLRLVTFPRTTRLLSLVESPPRDASHPVLRQVPESWPRRQHQLRPRVRGQSGGRPQRGPRLQVPRAEGLGGDQEGNIHSNWNKRCADSQKTPEPEKSPWPQRAARRWENKWDPINLLGSGVRCCPC